MQSRFNSLLPASNHMCQRVVAHPIPWRFRRVIARFIHPIPANARGSTVDFTSACLRGGSSAGATQAARPRGYGLSREIDSVSITPCPEEPERLGQTCSLHRLVEASSSIRCPAKPFGASCAFRHVPDGSPFTHRPRAIDRCVGSDDLRGANRIRRSVLCLYPTTCIGYADSLRTQWPAVNHIGANVRKSGETTSTQRPTRPIHPSRASP